LLVVMGTGSARRDRRRGGRQAEGHLPSLLAMIVPPSSARAQPGDLIENAVGSTWRRCGRSAARPGADNGRTRDLRLGAQYSLDTGKVAWLPQGRSGTVARLEIVPPRGTPKNECARP
jgi:hypothetical protein